jgi:hypothetical protein
VAFILFLRAFCVLLSAGGGRDKIAVEQNTIRHVLVNSHRRKQLLVIRVNNERARSQPN